jgi:hypothetical protein
MSEAAEPSRVHRRLWRPADEYLPGLFAYAALYLWMAVRGSFDSAAAEYLWQSLGRDALERQPLRSLWVNHIQPPGLNAIYVIALQTGHPGGFLQMVWGVAGLGTVVLVVATARAMGVSTRISAAAGLVYALVPTTVLYTMFPYNTTLVAFLLMLSVWATARIIHRQPGGVVTLTVATVGLFLLRPSFVWPFAVAWMFLPVLLRRRELGRRGWMAMSVGALCVLAVQGHYLLEFHLPTTSSWSGQNLVKGLVLSGSVTSVDLVAAAKGDPCLESIAAKPVFFDDLGSFSPRCFGARNDLRGTAIALDRPTKADGVTLQHNDVARLELSAAWNRLALQLVERHPLALLKMAFGGGSSSRIHQGNVTPSGLELALRAGHDYPAFTANLQAGAPVLTMLRPLGAVLPAASLAIVAAGVAMLRLRRRWGEPGVRVYAVGAVLISYSLIVAVFVEWGENVRFLTEAYPVMVCCAAYAVDDWRRVIPGSGAEAGGEIDEEAGPEAGGAA